MNSQPATATITRPVYTSPTRLASLPQSSVTQPVSTFTSPPAQRSQSTTFTAFATRFNDATRCKRCGGKLFRGSEYPQECVNCSAGHTVSGELIQPRRFAPSYLHQVSVQARFR